MNRRLVSLAHQRNVALEAKLDACLFSEEEREKTSSVKTAAEVAGVGTTGGAALVAHRVVRNNGGYRTVGDSMAGSAKKGLDAFQKGYTREGGRFAKKSIKRGLSGASKQVGKDLLKAVKNVRLSGLHGHVTQLNAKLDNLHEFARDDDQPGLADRVNGSLVQGTKGALVGGALGAGAGALLGGRAAIGGVLGASIGSKLGGMSGFVAPKRSDGSLTGTAAKVGAVVGAGVLANRVAQRAGGWGAVGSATKNTGQAVLDAAKANGLGAASKVAGGALKTGAKAVGAEGSDLLKRAAAKLVRAA